MGVLGWLTIALSAVWFITGFTLSIRKRSQERSGAKDRLSLLVMRAATVVSIGDTVAAEFAPVLIGRTGKIAALPLAATLYRISVEETVLLDHFGAAYEDYKKHTKSLIPRII